MKKTQIGWVIIAVILILNCIVIYKCPDNSDVIKISIVSFFVLILFYRLTINVTDQYVKFSFGIGLIRGKYPLDRIISCKPITYVNMGCGIRWRPGVILFNVSGHKAIELEIKGKNNKIWIGTDSPEEISGYVNFKTGRKHHLV